MADPSSGSFLAQPEFWVAASFVAFFVVVWKPLRSALVGGLDARAERIRKELDETPRLREEAQTLLADFQRKQRDAIQEAETIVARARGEAERLQRDAQARLEAELKRREAQAMQRIAQAEQSAAAEVRTAAVDIALAATRQILAQKLDETAQGRLIDEAIRELPGKLN
ncbi:MAG: F0F1 ATP synthase subunit B [Alphaproteobacteria bacterium]